MSDERDLPTIKQILQKADSIGKIPLSDAESQWWFDRTVESNQGKRAAQKGGDR